MNKITVRVDGMMCGMCEAHVCDAIRKSFQEAKKVKAAKSKGIVEFLTETIPFNNAVENAITETGYSFVSLKTEEYKKEGLFSKLMSK